MTQCRLVQYVCLHEAWRYRGVGSLSLSLSLSLLHALPLLYKVLTYCIPGNFSDVETLANLAINSFSLKLQVANLVLHCSTSTSTR